jgi:hypothetical protein
MENTMKALRNFLTAVLLSAGLHLAAPVPGWSAVTHGIQGIANTNYTGFVIDADALSPDPARNREDLLVQSRVRTTNPDGPVLTTYYLSFRLLDTQGQPHPLYDTAGLPSADATYRITNTFIIGGGLTLSRTNVARLRPAARLSPAETYSVEVRLFTPGGFRETDSQTTSPQPFIHFTNLVSNDPGFNVVATVDHVTFVRRSAVQTDPDHQAFQADVEYTLHRYDNFDSAANPLGGVPVTLTWQLIDHATGAVLGLASDTTNFTRTLFNYTPPAAGSLISPWSSTASRTVHIRTASGVQLDSVDGRYRLAATISHLEQAGVPASFRIGTTQSSPATQLLHFNGTLRFGSLATTFASIDNDPLALGTVAASHVNTILSVDDQSGTIPGLPGVHYGDGTDLIVHLWPNGDAVSAGGNLPLNLPPAASVKVNNVRMQLLAPVSLTPAGLVGGIRVHLPTGLGYREDKAGHVLRRSFVALAVPLGTNLRPLNDVAFTPALPVYAVAESRPLWLETASIVWRVAQGRVDCNLLNGGVQHVRADEYARLAAVDAVLENTQRSLKRSNDRFYEAAQSALSPVTAQADAQCVARVSLNLTLAPGEFRSHFPYDARIAWASPGALNVEADAVDSGSSQLAGVSPVALSYGTGCHGADCGPGATDQTLRVLPADGVLRFTRDGGLVAAGNLDAPTRLRWGYIPSLTAYAHEAFNFSAAQFHMAGHALRGDQSTLSIAHRPAALLYTGVAATNLSYLERPDAAGTTNQAGYQLGFADYAGVNVAVQADVVRHGRSVLAGTPTGDYQLRPHSKYYARRGGVSGIHDAISNTFPASLTLYGYQFDFANFGLSCLDNQMHDSLIDGLIEVPYPSQFQQEFAGLRLNCLGAVENAPMPEPSLARPLAYWNGAFDALALQFRRDPEDLCNVTNAFLTLGARTQVAHVTNLLYGTLGFRPNGNLLPRSGGLADIDSRLKLPNVVLLAGPREEHYTLNPVADVYFNGHDQTNGPSPEVGWVNIAGSIDVPFFEDLRVHLQTSATGGSTDAPIYLMGGWPTHGWNAPGGGNYFTADYFDDVNRGYAHLVSPLTYRDSETEAYHPRATRTWLKVVDFDYPLTWSSTTRDFRSQAPRAHDLLILHTENELKYLSAGQAEITFGAQFDGLPQFNLANLAYQAIDLATSTGNNYLAGKLTDMVGGFGRLDEILSADLDPFFSGVFDVRLDPKINALYEQLVSAYEDAPQDWPNQAEIQVQAALQTDFDSVAQRLHGLAQAGMVQRLDAYLQQAEQAVGQVESILGENGAGERQIASELMHLLVDNLAAEFAGGFLNELVQPIVAEADPTLDQIHLVLGNLHTALSQIRGTLANPGGMGAELQALFNSHAPEINATVPAMIGGIEDYIHDIDLALDSPVTDYTPAEIKQRIRREIEDRFYATTLAAGIQTIHKHRLYDADAAIRQATDTVFQELNNVIRLVISQTAEELNSAFTQLLPPLDQVAATARLNGYAHINGDSLKEARLDLHTRLELGAALEFNGYLQIKELDSQGSPGCSYPGTDSVTEVTLGAEDVQVGWISPDLRASVGTKFTFDDGGDHFPLRGMGGSFELTGKLEYEAFAINYLGASLALGVDENFLSGAAGMRVNKYDVFGGIYFGKACSVAPIELWDKDAGNLLGNGSFTGIYAYGEGWVPINELIGIPASCLFNISAGLGMGAGVFLEGPTFVAKLKAGVSGEALCLVGIKGELTGTGVLEGLDANVLDGLSIKAKGTVGGKFGPCPFCLEVDQSVALTFNQGHWKFDF